MIQHLKSGFFRLFFLITALLNGGLVLLAQQLEFEHINRSNGLPSNNVTSIVQDKYGMMWFGTYNGVVRFDGYNYKVFLHDSKDSTSIADNGIRQLLILPDGNLLLANEHHGFALFDYETETFKRYTHKNGDKNSLSNNDILTVYKDSKKNVWLGTWDGLNRFDPVSGRFQFFPINSHLISGNKSDFVSSIVEEKPGILLLYTAASRIVRFTIATGHTEFVHFPDLPTPRLRLNRGGILDKDSHGFLWVGTEFNGLYRMDPRTGEIRNYSVENHKLGSNVLMHTFQDSKNRLWVATDGGGLYLYDYSCDSFVAYKYDPTDHTTISSNAVYCMYEDKNSNVWIGTYGGGLSILKNHKRKFEVYSNIGKPGRALSYKSVLSFAKADSGRIWIGTDGGGLNLFDPAKKTFRHYNKSNSGICSDIIKTLLRDQAGHVWIGTFASGACRFNPQEHTFTHFDPQAAQPGKRINHFNVWSLQEDKAHNIWMGFLDAGLDEYHVRKDSLVRYDFKDFQKKGLTDGSIMSMLIDNEGVIWAGTGSGGLCTMDTNRRMFKNFATFHEGKEAVNVQNIFQDSKNNIWVGTKQLGLSLLTDRKKGTFTTFTTKDGLPSDNITGMEEDSHGNFWISTDNGLCFFDVKKRTFRTFDKNDGLQSVEFNAKAVLKDDKGYMYFGGTDGFNRFHPDSIVYNTAIPSVYISGINVFNKPVASKVQANDKVYFTRPVHLLDTLSLSYSDYVFSIEFTCTDYTTPEKNKFAYKLDGFDADWNYVGASMRQANYTNLSPGTYVFMVKASNNDGIWNEKGAKLVVVVHPPWWQTWWFRLTAIVLMITAFATFYYVRLKQIRMRNLILSKLVRQKTSELQGANNRLQKQNIKINNTNEQLEAQNQEILFKNSQILLQQAEIVQQKDELEIKNGQLNLLNGTKDRLFSIIGHDLRNPVAALAALTDMLQKNYQQLTEKDRFQILGHIQTSAASLKLMVTNLLDWAQVQSKHLNPHPTILSVHKLTEECFELLGLQAHAKNIQLVSHCQDSHYVYADSHMLETILRNLVGNAVKFTPRNGKITVSTTMLEYDALLITVADTGEGMNQQKIDQLLSREKLLSTKGTSEEKGSGLGLVIVREFVEANQGRMEIKSSPGAGTSFHIYLPMTSE